MAARDGAGAPPRLLVPTARKLSAEVAARGEIVALDDALSLDGDRLVLRGAARAANLRLVPREAKSPKLGALPPPGCWDDVCFGAMDEHTLRVRIGGKVARLSCVDLGMAMVKSGRPKRAFILLVAFVDGGGVFKGRGMGTTGVVTRLVSTLRADLKRIFALEDEPIAEYAKVGWVARFRVEREDET